MTNPFVLNPALAGTNNYFQVISSNRFQWVGFSDAPITNSLSVYGPAGKTAHGLGRNNLVTMWQVPSAWVPFMVPMPIIITLMRT